MDPEALQTTEFEVDGVQYRFVCSTPTDAIQATLLDGRLFDQNELMTVAKYITDGDRIADIGANIGNHAVFFSKRFPASEIVCFEPNEEAMFLLQRNLEENNCTNVVQDFIGYGLSDEPGDAISWRGGDNNLGGSRVVDLSHADMVKAHPDKFHYTKLTTGDEVFLEGGVDFLKIDVEGHEIPCLNGLRQTITRHRPVIFVEISNENMDEVMGMFDAFGYREEWVDTHYAKVTNKIMLPN